MATTKTNTFTLTVYKNEYNAAFVEFLTRKYDSAVGNKTVTLYDLTEAECDKIMGLQYKEAEACALAYPEFKTMAQEVASLTAFMQEQNRIMVERMCAFISSPAMHVGELMNEEQRAAYVQALDAITKFGKMI